ncbi:hypothetical protein RZN22_08560 [Bacillaceae bacterium S4-13-58]
MSKLYNKYKRFKKEAQTELGQLIAEFKEDLGPAVRNEEELLEEVKIHLIAEAKSTTNIGSRAIFLALAVGTTLFLLSSIMLRMWESKSLKRSLLVS